MLRLFLVNQIVFYNLQWVCVIVIHLNLHWNCDPAVLADPLLKETRTIWHEGLLFLYWSF